MGTQWVLQAKFTAVRYYVAEDPDGWPEKKSVNGPMINSWNHLWIVMLPGVFTKTIAAKVSKTSGLVETEHGQGIHRLYWEGSMT